MDSTLSKLDTSGRADVAVRLDSLPVTALHILVISVCAFGFVFDLMEVALGSVLSAVFSMEPNKLSASQLSVLLASMYVGAVLGAPALGWVADRYGRRITLMGVLFWLGLSSAAAAASEGTDGLSICRALSGLALGAYPPLVTAYLTDLLPPGRRGLLFMLTSSVAALGAPLAVFGVRALSHLHASGMEAWRWGLVIGAAGAALAALLFVLLPESPRWLKAKGRQAEADRVCSAFEHSRALLSAGVMAAAADPQDAGSSAPPVRGLWPRLAALFLLSPWATVAFPLLTGAILAQKGFALSDTLFYVGVSTLGPLIGNAVAGFGLDRLDRRRLLMLCAIAMILGGALFIQTSTPWLLVLANLLFGVTCSVYILAMNLYGSELFPTAQRATSLASAWSMNRLGAVAAPFLLLPLLKSSGPAAMFAVIALALLASVVLLALSPPGRQHQPIS